MVIPIVLEQTSIAALVLDLYKYYYYIVVSVY